MQGLRVGVCGALVVDARVLMVRHTYANRYGKGKDQWWLPGGYARAGETLPRAVVREVQEETGLGVEPLGIIGVRSRWEDVVLAFLLGRPRGELRPDRYEVHEARFFSAAELGELANVMELSRVFARAALQGGHSLLPPNGFRPTGTDAERYVLYL